MFIRRTELSLMAIDANVSLSCLEMGMGGFSCHCCNLTTPSLHGTPALNKMVLLSLECTLESFPAGVDAGY